MPEGVALKHGGAVLTNFHLLPMDSRTGQTAYLKVALIVTDKTFSMHRGRVSPNEDSAFAVFCEQPLAPTSEMRRNAM